VSPKEETGYTLDKDSAVLRVTGSYLDSIDATSTGTVSQDDTFEELTALFDSWKTFAQDALSRTDIEYMEQRYISEDLLGLEKEKILDRTAFCWSRPWSFLTLFAAGRAVAGRSIAP
jgi:hypothetical protein